MDLGDFLLEVSSTYDRSAPMSSSAQVLLRRAQDHLGNIVPGGMLIIGSGGKSNPAFVPWVGVFDPDETTSPQDGIYVVYLFATDLHRVTLSLNQGITQTKNRLKSFREARTVLANDAAAIRERFNAPEVEGLSASIDLDPQGIAKGRYDENLRTYASANIWATAYDLDDAPPESILRADLLRFLSLYESAVITKRNLLQAAPGVIGSASSEQMSGALNEDPLRRFKPKNDTDYITHIGGQKLVKTRRHETLVRQYGEWAQGEGFEASTSEHPKDLVLRRASQEWLVEAKIVRRGNAMFAVREAVGQLLMYRRLNYDKPPDGLVALFSEDIGDLFAKFLDDLSIAAVWRAGGHWKGSALAIDLGLTSGGQPIGG